MKKIKLLFFITLILSSVLLSAQNKHSLIAKFDSADKVIVQESNQTNSAFSVTCSSEMIKTMQTTVEDYSSDISFVYSENTKDKGSYNCVMTFNHVAVPMEFYKPFYMMGFTGLNIAGKDYSLDYILTIK